MAPTPPTPPTAPFPATRPRRLLTFLLPIPLFFAPFLVLLGPGVIGSRLASLLFFPAGLLAFAFRSVTIALAISGLFWYLAGVALIALLLSRRGPNTRWWHLGPAGWLLIILCLIAAFTARCYVNFDPD